MTTNLEGALCIGHSPELWFADTKTPNDRDARAFAIALCKGCPVRQRCLDAALEVEGNVAGSGRFGIRGGLTPGQRARLRPPPPEPTGRVLIPCPSEAAYRRHLRRGERCEACLAANRVVTYASKAKGMAA